MDSRSLLALKGLPCHYLYILFLNKGFIHSKIKQISRSQFKTVIRDNLNKILKDYDDYLR